MRISSKITLDILPSGDQLKATGEVPVLIYYHKESASYWPVLVTQSGAFHFTPDGLAPLPFPLDSETFQFLKEVWDKALERALDRKRLGFPLGKKWSEATIITVPSARVLYSEDGRKHYENAEVSFIASYKRFKVTVNATVWRSKGQAERMSGTATLLGLLRACHLAFSQAQEQTLVLDAEKPEESVVAIVGPGLVVLQMADEKVVLSAEAMYEAVLGVFSVFLYAVLPEFKTVGAVSTRGVLPPSVEQAKVSSRGSKDKVVEEQPQGPTENAEEGTSTAEPDSPGEMKEVAETATEEGQGQEGQEAGEQTEGEEKEGGKNKMDIPEFLKKLF